MASDLNRSGYCCEMEVITPDGYKEILRYDSYAVLEMEGRRLHKKGYQILWWFCDTEELRQYG